MITTFFPSKKTYVRYYHYEVLSFIYLIKIYSKVCSKVSHNIGNIYDSY